MATRKCKSCRNRPVAVKARGWCRACDDRWKRAGKPEDGPPSPTRGGRPRDPKTDARVRETGRLLDAGVRPAEIARRLKVPESTVYYYRKRLREAVAA